MRELDKEAMFPKDNIAGDTKTMRDENDKRQDHNTDIPFEFRHNQENNKALTTAQVCFAHMAGKEQNKHI